MTKKTLSALLVASALTGCSFAPHYTRPAVDAPAQWKTVDGWAPAQPADVAPRADWWSAFGDTALGDLIARAHAHNQTIAQAAATYRQAHFATREARASLFPTISASGSVTHSESGGSRTIVTGGATSSAGSRSSTSYSLGLDGTWQPDLFGKIANTVSNAKATEQARGADLANAQLAIDGELATDYLGLRAADAQIASLSATVAAYQRSLQIATNRYNAGIVAHTDVFQGQSQLASAQSDLEGQKRTRAQFENAIAVLVGENPAAFTLAAVANWTPTTPDVPVDVPSTLLERRPDVASAERAVAAANAQIGVDRAAFFPALTLSGSGGFNNDTLKGLFSSAASLWSVGASLAQTIFDAGARGARVKQDRAAYDAAVANYRQVTLTAFQNVQDNLAATAILARQEALLRQASVAADRSEASVRFQYQSGIVVYTDVVTAQATALSARRALIQIQSDRQTTAVALVQALGGGWTAAN
jgi:NodT family efflux transporter outer membrane factor (OMF) lipoprotein